MVALHEIAGASVGHGSHQYGFVRSKIISRVAFIGLAMQVAAQVDHVEDGGREIGDRPAFLQRDVAGHGDGFEINLGSHHGRADVEKRAALEPGRALGESQKVGVSGLARGRRVEVGMLVYDILSERHMHGNRNFVSNSGGQNARIFVGKFVSEIAAP